MTAARVASVYDVHGNVPALEPVLAEILREEPDVVVVGGDVVYGPMPREALELLLELDAPTIFIRGNTDREVAGRYGTAQGLDEEDEAVLGWCADQLTGDQLAFLRRLPEQTTVDVERLGRVLFCHGSPRSDEECITAGTSPGRLREMLADVDDEVAVVVCGHTHAQFARELDGRRIVNPGSVGRQFGERAAYWATFGPHVELRRTAYDVELGARRLRAAGGPLADDFAEHVLEPPPAARAVELYTGE
jgi:putative phosphoesterase